MKLADLGLHCLLKKWYSISKCEAHNVLKEANKYIFGACADPDVGTGGPDPPEKSQKYRVF